MIMDASNIDPRFGGVDRLLSMLRRIKKGIIQCG
jgi:hypothetical protein